MLIRNLIAVLLGVLSAVSMGTGNVLSPPPHELYGFLLEQDEKAFEHALGKPFNSGAGPDRLPYKAYMIPGTSESYLLAAFREGKAIKLELTGKDYSGPTGFFGLTLGEDATAVEGILGKPNEIRHEDDANVDLWDYKTSNYTLEFTPDRKLYSIQVIEGASQKPPGFAGSKEARKFASAVRSADNETVVQMSSGSLLCTKGAELEFSGAARTDLTDPKGKLAACLKSAADAILELGPKMNGADDQFRIAERGGPFCVTKFAAASPLKEVVFVWEVNAWRVYEVTFR